MQAYRIDQRKACWHLSAACTASLDERFGGDKRTAMPGLPGRARRLSPYLRSHRRRRRGDRS